MNEYIEKTKGAVKFLLHVYDKSVAHQATIVNAQADKDTKTIIAYLNIIGEQIQDWIEELEDIE